MNEQPKHHDDPASLDGDERRLIETLRSQLDPGAASPAQRAAFRARLEERLEGRSRPAWGSLALAASAAAAAAALWLSLSTGLPGADRTEPASVASATPGLLVYAYYETDYLADGAAAPSGFLSDEYQAIASAFEVD